MGKREIIIAWRLCCYYTDGKNTCDPQVTRAAAAEFSGRYCVLYLKDVILQRRVGPITK